MTVLGSQPLGPKLGIRMLWNIIGGAKGQSVRWCRPGDQFKIQGNVGVTDCGMEIVFKNLVVTRGERRILSDLSGVARPGRVLAVMGPSGCGKTTLLNCLAGRTLLDHGEIAMDGIPVNKSLRRKLSYVMQEDSFFPNLTLRETLSFTTMLRLPDKLPKSEKIQRMEAIIDDLDIRKCQHTIMGDAWCRGISGGEKKRASIACELITDPAIIFLDEPTSGLDYSTASSLVRTLRTITEAQKKTLVMTIHQPSSQMFFTFHDLLLLSDGQMAFFGLCANVIDFFHKAGLVMDAHYNPADFISMLLIFVSPVFCLLSITAIYFHDKYYFSQKTETDSVHVSLVHLDGQESNHTFEDQSHTQKWATGWVTQYVQLTTRTFRQSRTRILSRLKIMESVLLCLLVSIVWFQLPHTEETLRDRMGALFFTIIHWGFTPLFDAVSSFPMERVVIHKERSAGWYRLSAYYLAKMTSELPLILVQPGIFVAVSYWCIGFNGVGPFFGTVFIMMVNAIAGQSIGLFLGILCMDFRKAMTVATIFMMAIMLLGIVLDMLN
ncbi:hypothetical protein C0Q70_05211 [Pomacea canaliculata]|uniref:ABC transporter domain-containing protein n=1 Tax=Pomacea canaliculata TaxID=400727 RepID=A0A2T7PKJ2_POMCA|nr:hypothetical protein C0Q70_05211 [Pomacea canaliculata]